MRWYHALLRFYPQSFRAEYGDEMAAIFSERLRTAEGWRPWLSAWFEAILDAAVNAPALHADLLAQDLRLAVRTLRRTPAFALAAVLIAALGIGATTVTFGVADHVLVRPLPFPDADRLVKVYQDQTFRGYPRMEVSPPNFLDWKSTSRSFERLAAYTSQSATLVGVGDPVRLNGVIATGDLFATLGVPAALGRGLTSADDRDGGERVLVISHRLWATQFGAQSAVIGQSVLLDDIPHVIVGVMPPYFNFPSREAAYWAPLRFTPSQLEDRTNWWLNSVGRLKDGVTLTEARAEMRTIAAQLAQAYPAANDRNGIAVLFLRDEVSWRSRQMLWALAGAALCMLLIACTNLASLLLSRALGRQRELAVRAALGAGRERLVRQMLTENMVIAGLGGVLGSVAAVLAVPFVARLVPTTLPIPESPGVDARLLVGAVVVTLATGLVFGALPALKVAATATLAGLREGARSGSSRGTERLRSALVIAEVSISLVLLVCAALLVQSLWRVQNVNPGFDTTGVLTLRTALPVPKYAPTQLRERFYQQVLSNVRSVPGVAQAAYISFLPMVMRGGIWPVTVDGRAEDPNSAHTASLRLVTAGFFETLGIPRLAGRDIQDGDIQGAPRVAIVSQSFVDRHWPGQDALGRRLSMALADSTIVGVVGDVKVRGLERDSEPQVYLPSAQVADGSLVFYAPKDLVIRTEGAPMALVPAVRAAVASADPQVPLSDIRPLTEVVEADSAARSVQVKVLAAFTAMAIALAAAGLHSLLAFTVSARTREIGVRMAMGATRAHILRMVFLKGLALAGIGTCIGALFAAWAAGALRSLLFGVHPWEPTVFLGAIGVCAAMALVGSMLPALRATRVDPIEALRAE
jgi:predicted permease